MTTNEQREAAIEAITGGTISAPRESGGYGNLARDDAESIVDAVLAAVSDTTPNKPSAKVVPVSHDSSPSCSQGVCPSWCSHLMWECKACSCEGGWGASRERLEGLAAEHVCVAVAPAPSEGWSTEDRRNAETEAKSRWPIHEAHTFDTERDQIIFQQGCINGFMLGAEWWKAMHVESAKGECVCTSAIAGISDGPNIECPTHGAPTPSEGERSNLAHRMVLSKIVSEWGAALYTMEETVDRLAALTPPAPVDGSTSDGHHTFDELYEYRMLYNAHAAHGWLAEGLPVVKSWKHSDGEPCFGGGWFIVTATLPSGQVSNHYRAEHWDLFKVPEVELPPEYDGHTPQDAAARLAAALAVSPAPPHIPYPGEPFNPAHIHDWADGACQSPDCMARLDGTTQRGSTAPARDEWEYATTEHGIDLQPHGRLTRGEITPREWFDSLDSEDRERLQLLRRRKVGPWLPVTEEEN